MSLYLARPINALNCPRNTPQPFNLEPIKSEFILSTKRGHSVNCTKLHIIPHANGTHTESMSHIDEKEATIADIYDCIPLRLIGVFLRVPSQYLKNDEISIESLNQILASLCISNPGQIQSIFIHYDSLDQDNFNSFPTFEWEATEHLLDLYPNAQHLLTNAPSVDKAADGGLLRNHKSLWFRHAKGTITELCRTLPKEELLPSTGTYEISLGGLVPIRTDAVLSSPILFTAPLFI